MLKQLIATVVVAGLLTSVAQARYIEWMEQTPVEVEALDLPHGDWVEGEDYGFAGLQMWMNERWTCSLGATVMHMVEVELATPGTRTPITLHKEVENDTDFFWSAFQIDLEPNPGSTISLVAAAPSVDFRRVTIDDNGDGTWTMLWEMLAGDPGVPIGDTTAFDFHFNLGGDLSFNITETPIPEPAAAVLIAAGFLLFFRRSRA